MSFTSLYWEFRYKFKLELANRSLKEFEEIWKENPFKHNPIWKFDFKKDAIILILVTPRWVPNSVSAVEMIYSTLNSIGNHILTLDKGKINFTFSTLPITRNMSGKFVSFATRDMLKSSNLTLATNFYNQILTANFIEKENINLEQGETSSWIKMAVPYCFSNYEEMIKKERALYSVKEYKYFVNDWREAKKVGFNFEDNFFINSYLN